MKWWPLLLVLLLRQCTIGSDPHGDCGSLLLLPHPLPCTSSQVHSMIQRLAQFTDIQAALVVGGLSLQAQAATLRAQPEIVVATPVRHWCCRAIAPWRLGFVTSSRAHCLPASCLCACCRAAPTPTMGRRQRSGARANRAQAFQAAAALTSVPLCSTCAHSPNNICFCCLFVRAVQPLCRTILHFDLSARHLSQGRMIDHLRNTQSVGLEDLAVLILDEADRLLEMGFAEEVRLRAVLGVGR